MQLRATHAMLHAMAATNIQRNNEEEVPRTCDNARRQQCSLNMYEGCNTPQTKNLIAFVSNHHRKENP